MEKNKQDGGLYSIIVPEIFMRQLFHYQLKAIIQKNVYKYLFFHKNIQYL